METFDLELLSEDEFNQLTGQSIKELQQMNRKEIIESVIPMGVDGEPKDFSCK